VSTKPPPARREDLARAVRDFLAALGHELVGELEGTPERVADAWLDELVGGQTMDGAEILREGSIALESETPGLVALRDVRVTLVCPHHLLPSRGVATVAFEPGTRTSGLGTLARALHAETRRLVLQETAGARVAEAIVAGLGARAAGCRIELVHACLSDRGEREIDARVITVSYAGEPASRDALARLLGQP